MDKQYEWIPYLEESIPKEIQGYKVTSYTIALEAWRRGIEVKFTNRGRRIGKMRYTLKYNNKEYTFAGSRGNKVPLEAVKICMNKHLTKKYLNEAKVPTPKGEVFDKRISDEEVAEYADKLGYPLVIKPINGKGGHGVIANIKNKSEFVNALHYVRHDLGYKAIIVEEFIVGKDYRIYVLGDKVIGAFDRIPANVIGDGTNSIRSLLQFKNKARDKNPALYNNPIKIDKETHNLLKESDYHLDSIPPKGERVFLKTKSNVSSGGDSVDVTDKLTEEIKSIAVNATKAIPGLVQSGVDMRVDENGNTGVILEINSRPSIRNHLFPMEGKARDIAKAIVDFYFPETVNYYVKNEVPYYFDFQSVVDAFEAGYAKEVIVTDMPKGDIAATRFVVKGTHLGNKYKKWVARRAKKYNLDGYVKKLKNNDISIVISGKANIVKKFRYVIKNKSPKDSNIENVIEKKRNSPIKVGFEIKDDNIPNKKTKIHIDEYKKLQRELHLYQKKYNDLKSQKVKKSFFHKIKSLIKN